jgi:hypothetical protein
MNTSVTLSTSIVTTTESTGSSGIVSRGSWPVDGDVGAAALIGLVLSSVHTTPW